MLVFFTLFMPKKRNWKSSKNGWKVLFKVEWLSKCCITIFWSSETRERFLWCNLCQIPAHKLVLASCSTFFKSILKTNEHSHPLLYLSGLNSKSLGYILDYMYQGEVKIVQGHLDSFLDSAQKLKIKGLQAQNSHGEADEVEYGTSEEDGRLKDYTSLQNSKEELFSPGDQFVNSVSVPVSQTNMWQTKFTWTLLRNLRLIWRSMSFYRRRMEFWHQQHEKACWNPHRGTLLPMPDVWQTIQVSSLEMLLTVINHRIVAKDTLRN